MGSRAIGVAAVAALLATSGLATAQSFSVTLEPEGSADTLSPGASTSVDVLVQLQGEGFSCANDEDLPVNLTASSSQGVSGTPGTDQLVFSNTMGIHPSQQPYEESDTTTVSLQAADTASPGSREIQVTGTFPGGNYAPPDGSCNGEFPSAEGTTSLSVTVEDTGSDSGSGSDGGIGGGNGGSGGGNDTGPDGNESDDDSNGIPAATWAAPAALLSGALAARRRAS